MRLFDKVLSQCPESGVAQSIRQLSHLTVLACDVIAEYFHSQSGILAAGTYTGDMYPFCNCPWSSVFCEWNVRPEWGCGKGLQQIGFLSFALTNKEWKMMGMELRGEGGGGEFAGLADETPLIFSTPCLCLDGHTFAVDNLQLFGILNPNGSLLSIAINNKTAIPANGEWDLYKFYGVVLSAFTFANCSNVKLADATEELAPVPKIRRRLKIPEVKRYTLNICGHTSTPSREWNEGPKGVMPFHLCRGHFATYTEEKPLFGRKGAVGRYWHPPHMKGKKENGEIIKDYAIAEPAGV